MAAAGGRSRGNPPGAGPGPAAGSCGETSLSPLPVLSEGPRPRCPNFHGHAPAQGTEAGRESWECSWGKENIAGTPPSPFWNGPSSRWASAGHGHCHTQRLWRAGTGIFCSHCGTVTRLRKTPKEFRAPKIYKGFGATKVHQGQGLPGSEELCQILLNPWIYGRVALGKCQGGAGMCWNVWGPGQVCSGGIGNQQLAGDP